MKQLVLTGLLISPLFLLAACGGSTPAANTYTTAEAGRMQKVELGTVIGSRKVKIEQNSTDTGKIAGGIIGGAAGSELGDGKTSVVGGAAGAVVGGAVGAVVDRAVQAKQGVEITLKLEERNEVIAIVQLADHKFKPGDQVKVVTSKGVSRVTPLSESKPEEPEEPELITTSTTQSK